MFWSVFGGKNFYIFVYAEIQVKQHTNHTFKFAIRLNWLSQTFHVNEFILSKPKLGQLNYLGKKCFGPNTKRVRLLYMAIKIKKTIFIVLALINVTSI